MARLNSPRSDQPTRLAVVADPHLSTREEGTSKLFDRTERHLRAAVADVRERDVDALLSVGDITKDGEPWNYERFDEIVADLDVPFYSVPGNHDVPKERDEHDNPDVEWYADRYAPDGEYPFVTRIGGVDVVGVNSAGTRDLLYDSHSGRVSEAALDWLAETLPGLDDPVVLTHFNLPPTFEQLRAHRDAVEPEMFVPPEMENPEAFVDVLAANDVPLLLTGHLHMPSTAEMDGVREVMVPTTCSFPQSYVVVEVDASGTTVRYIPVADHEEMRYGFSERSGDSVTSRGLTSMAAVRLANFPLVDERGD